MRYEEKLIAQPYFIVAFLGLIISTLTILPMPQNLNERSRDIMMPRSLFPIAAIVAIALNTMLACTQVDGIWPGLLCWICSGNKINCRLLKTTIAMCLFS